MTVYNYLLSAVATSTAQATVQPTIGLLPMPRNPIISTCAGTDDDPANCASECIRPMVSVIYPMATVRTRYVRVYTIGQQYRMKQYFVRIRVAICLRSRHSVALIFFRKYFRSLIYLDRNPSNTQKSIALNLHNQWKILILQEI